VGGLAKHVSCHMFCFLSIPFLANMNVERELTFTFAICYHPSNCRLSVTFVHPTQAVQIFGNISTALGTSAIHRLSTDIHLKFHGDCPSGTPPPGELNTRGVAKYTDFGPIDGYISEKVQDRR